MYADLALLMAHDTDSFNAWDAADKLSSHVILTLARDKSQQGWRGYIYRTAIRICF